MTESRPKYNSAVVTVSGLHRPQSRIRLQIPGRYVIGASFDSDIKVTDDNTTARYHAALELNELTCEVSDLGSTGGTFLNGAPITTSALQNGDKVRCGSSILTIEFLQIEMLTETLLQSAAERALADNDTDTSPIIQGYSLQSRIGAGGLGVVYKAVQLGTNREVAIKCIRADLQTDERVRQLFIREASIISRMKHPGIVDCLGFGFEDDNPYLVMEYIPADDLESIVLKHAPARRVRLAVKVVLQILDALRYAHRQGIVHRDIKLSNVLAQRRKQRLHVKLSDFGLAKLFQTAGYSGITKSGELCGTVSYMSPEQIADSRNAKPECDIYSVVVCLFRLLTGQFPYPDGPVAKMIRQRIHEDPRRVKDFNPDVSDELASIVDSGLSRSVEKRIVTAQSLYEALQSTLNDRQETS